MRFMKIINIPRINGLGQKGSEEMGDKVLEKLKIKGEKVNVDNSDVESSEKIIYSKAQEIFGSTYGHDSGESKYEKVCFVGGDHSITYPIFKAFSEVNKNAFLIVFDAHADCMPPMKEPTHEEFLRAIIEKGFDASKIILVGLRKFEDVEIKFLKDNGVKIFGEIDNLEAVGDYITEKANGMDVYVSVDIDVLDPAFAPAVNYPEPNGLSSRELFYLLKRIFYIKSLKALDVVEAVPEKDEKYDYQTVNIVTKIVEEFIKSQ